MMGFRSVANRDNAGYPERGKLVSAVTSLPSYENTGGRGDRLSLITATSTMTFDQGNATVFIDGVMSGVTGYFGSQNVAGKYVRFQFPKRVLITEIAYHSNYGGTSYYWHVQGSNDGSSWTTLVDNVQITEVTQVIPVPNKNSYLYYQLLGVSGNTSPSPRFYDMWFKIRGL